MDNIDKNKTYLLMAGVLTIIVYFIYFESTDKFNCDDWAKTIRDKKEFNLVLAKKENHEGSRDSYLHGTDIQKKIETEYYDGSGWITHNLEKFNIGDTLIKEKGKYTIVIKRNGTIILIPLECNGKIYKDK